MQQKSNRSGIPARERAPQKQEERQGLENQNVTQPVPVDQPSDNENEKEPRPALEDRNITQANPPQNTGEGR